MSTTKHLIVLVALLLPTPCFAASLPFEDAYLCQNHFSFYEKNNNLPKSLLHSISLTETGIWSSTHRKKVPWPWSINANGKSYILPTKDDAVKKVKALQKRGIKSIDIGCMQVNLFYHKNAFASIEQGFDPEHNIKYAAYFLRELYEKHKNWHHAIAFYHSSKPGPQSEYLKKVLSFYPNLRNPKKPKPIVSVRTGTYSSPKEKQKRIISISRKSMEYKMKDF